LLILFQRELPVRMYVLFSIFLSIILIKRSVAALCFFYQALLNFINSHIFRYDIMKDIF
jgi:hypothetical protein